jgi:mRNA interferase RelE/StbE
VPSRRYRLIIANRFARDLKRLDRQVQGRVLEALERLEQDPYRGEKVVAQETGSWRFRVGDWRIRHDIVGDEVHLLRVRHRREVYRGE